MSIFISVATAFLCFFLILYFRRMDKRNTQLQTLKNFIASSINNMKMMFQDKEKELLDKTINLDISLKKLDKASTYINNKLMDIKDTLASFQEIKEGISGDIKQASRFNSDIASLREKLTDINAVSGDVDGLKREMNEMKKLSDDLRSEVEESRDWVKSSVEDFRANALAELDDREREIESTIEKQISEFSSDFTTKADEVRNGLNMTIEEYKKETDVSAGDIINGAKELKESVSETLSEFNGRWNETVKRFNEMNRDVMSKTSIMESRLEKSGKDLEIRLEDAKALINTRTGEMTKALTQALEAGKASIEDKKAGLEERVNALSAGLDRQLGDIEKGYNSRIEGMDERISSLKSEIDGLQDKITGEARSIFSSMENEIAGEIEAMKRSALAKADERLKNIEEMYSKSEDQLEDEFNKQISDINSRLVANSSAINEMGGKLSGFVRDVTDKFKDDIALLQKQATVEARDVIAEIGEKEKELNTLQQAAREEIKVMGRETAESALQRIKDREKEIINMIEKSAGSVGEKVSRLDNIVGKFESEFDRSRSEIAGSVASLKSDVDGLQDKLTGKAENLFGRLENDIAGEIEKLKKSALSKADERLKALEDMYSKSGEELEEDFNKKVSGINSRLVANSSAINELGGKLNTFVRDVTEKFKGDVAELQKQASVQAKDVINEIGSSEKELGVLMQTFREEIKAAGRESADSALQRIKDREKEIITVIEKSAGSINEKIMRLNGTVEHFESDFDKAQQQIAGLQEKITGKAENLFGRLENDIAGEIEELKKSALSKADERLKALEDMYSKSGEELEEDYNKRINDINARLVSNSSAINELGGKLNTFVRDVTEKFKGDVAELQKQASLQARDVIGEIGGKQKELNALLLSVRDEIKGLGREASESALQRIKDREKEIITVIEKTAGSVGEKIARLDSSVDRFEEGFNKKLSDTQASIMNELQEYKNNVEKLKVMGTNAQGEIDNIVAGKAEEMEKFINNLKIEFAGEYEGLLKETKGEIKNLGSEVAQARSAAAERKDLILKEVTAALEEARGWSLSQIGALKDEIESAKLRTGAMIEDIRDESEVMLKDYNSSLSEKLEETLKGADAEFLAKKSELKDLTNDMIVYVNDKDKEINKRIERLNTLMDDAVKKSEGQIISINRITEQRFQKFYEELAGKGEEGIHNFRQEIDGIVKELKAETLTTIELYKNELTGLKKGLSENREEILVIEKGMDSGKGAIENIRQEIAALEKAIDVKKAGFENLV
ncbi:MAG: hypothetical protein ABSG94_07415, partial [Brevinematales bacterium]